MAKRLLSGANDPLTRELKRLSGQMVDFAVALCSIPTVNPPGGCYGECCEFLADKLRSLGMATRIYRVPRALQAKVLPGSGKYPRYNVVGRWDALDGAL